MREIKFRAVHKNGGSMQDNKECLRLMYNQECQTFGNLTSYHLMQYTGLKDKNGKEIYEGDIVIYTDKDLDNTPCVIVFAGSSFSTECVVSKSLGDMYGFDLEIIGNKFENPELLTQTK